MAKIYNNEVGKGLAKNAGIQQNTDKVPNELAEKIVPTFETNPAVLRRCNIIKSGSSAATIYTTPTDQDFYLVGAELTAASQNQNSVKAATITAYPKGGANLSIIYVDVASGAASEDSNSASIVLPFPLLLERNTAIAITGTTSGVGGVIYGYVIENSNA